MLYDPRKKPKFELNSGAYVLWINIRRNVDMQIGKLAYLNFKVGAYLYTGSALRLLQQRLVRHLKSDKIKRWHIDHLTSHPWCEIENIFILFSLTKLECELNQSILTNIPATVVMNGFGSSDCKNGCGGHLIWLPSAITPRELYTFLQSQWGSAIDWIQLK